MDANKNKNGFTFQKNSKGYLVTGNLNGKPHSAEISNDISEEKIKNFDEKDFAQLKPGKIEAKN